MKKILVTIACVSFLSFSQLGQAQAANPAVPTLVNFSGVLSVPPGGQSSTLVGVTFSFYKEQLGGAPLWTETQNVQPDLAGHYSVMLGASKSAGLPAELFVSGQARWLGIQPQGAEEQARVLLLSVPYALKAGDAQTIGGLPPSAFVLAAPAANSASGASFASSTQSADEKSPAANVTGSGTTNYVPLWTSTSNIANSVLFQKGSGGSAKIGINTIAPATTLDVKGGATIRGLLNLPATGTATAASGKDSQPMNLASSVFNSGTSTAVTQTFQWLAEPVGNNTSSATGSLNLLFGQGVSKPTETGLRFASNGQITFAAGQTFPGTGNGTITGVTPGTDLTGGGSSGNVTLNLDTTQVPQLNVSNKFNGNQYITGTFSTSSFSALNVTQTSAQGSGIIVNSAGGGLQVIAGNGSAIQASTNAGYGVYGFVGGPFTGFSGIWGDSESPGNFGVLATNNSSTGQALWAETFSTGKANGAGPDGVHGVSHNATGSGVAGVNDASGGTGVYGAVFDNSSYAGRFDGNVFVNGTLSKNGGSFKIDHPLDPSNKYLYHSFVESPDMKNIYDGVAMLNGNGEAVVEMPDWFSALNRDFRYQLTCIGGFAPVYVAEEMANNQFKIGGGRPGMKVSWQVTGTRQDAWANAHRIPVEEVKPGDERGTYLHPELFGKPKESGLSWLHFGYPDNVQQKSPPRRRPIE